MNISQYRFSFQTNLIISLFTFVQTFISDVNRSAAMNFLKKHKQEFGDLKKYAKTASDWYDLMDSLHAGQMGKFIMSKIDPETDNILDKPNILNWHHVLILNHIRISYPAYDHSIAYDFVRDPRTLSENIDLFSKLNSNNQPQGITHVFPDQLKPKKKEKSSSIKKLFGR